MMSDCKACIEGRDKGAIDQTKLKQQTSRNKAKKEVFNFQKCFTQF